MLHTKMCKLAIPLFFLVVKTNVNYCVIGEFIIQTEDTDSISEALHILNKFKNVIFSQMWVFLYRIGKQLYDHTNNRVESKNCIFKYNFLNCSWNLLMSCLLKLLVEMFILMQIKQLFFFFLVSKVVIQSTTLKLVLQSSTLKSCKHR